MNSFSSVLALTGTCVAIAAAPPTACCDTVRAMRAGTDRLAGLADAMNAAPTSRKVTVMASVVIELVNRQREMEAHMSGMQMSMAITDTATGLAAVASPSRVATAGSSASSSPAVIATPDSSRARGHRSSSPAARRAPSTAAAAAAPAALADTVSPAAIAAGRKIFHGPGTCAVCHGQNLEGTPMAPTLAAHTWKDAKGGGYAAILAVINKGVSGTAMAGRPGGISSDDAARVAAYVWAVSHGNAKP